MFSIQQTLQNCGLLSTFFNTKKTFQSCLKVVVGVLWRHNVGQCQINVEATFLNVKVEIYNVKNRRINIIYFNVDINNVRQCPNNVVIFNVEFHKVDQRRNNAVNMNIFKSWKEQKNILQVQEKMTHLINNTCFRLLLIKKKGKHGA